MKVWIAMGLTFALAASASAQAALWQTPEGGDAGGNYVRVELTEHEAELRGTRRVERIDAPSGYTTGTLARIVFSGSEPEARRTLRVHLPYGARLDLAAGDEVEVNATSRRLGLGTRQEALVTRRGQIVLLTTARERVNGIRVTRGAEIARTGSRRQWGLRVSIGARQVETMPGQLYVTSDSMLVMGQEIAYEGRRPPDAFDQRILTIVRISAPRSAP